MKKKIIAFGDIHGCYKAAERAILLSEELESKAIFLGDYVDRGSSALKTLKALINAKQNHPNWIFLRGNHDQMLLDLIAGKFQTDEKGHAIDGARFYYSQSKTSYEEWLAQSMEQKKKVKEFLNSTEFFHETNDYIFVHSILRETKEALKNKSNKELIFNYSYEPEWQGKPFIHGHRLVKEITAKYKGININTECGYGGFLTGLQIQLKDKFKCFICFTINENGDLAKKISVEF